MNTGNQYNKNYDNRDGEKNYDHVRDTGLIVFWNPAKG